MAKVTKPEDVESLQKEVARLTALLAEANTKNEEAARRAAFFTGPNEEVSTGEFVEVEKCYKYEIVSYRDDGRPILKPVYKKVKLPTFMYKVDLPPVGGVAITVNGEQFFHGETYTLDVDQLRSIKEMVHRIRDHEANIHGTDENAYRPKTHAQFSGKTGGRVH